MRKRKTTFVTNRAPAEVTTLTANLSGSVRHAKLQGRDYLVVPMVMLTEGVHNGSDGPLFYPKEELAKAPGVWDHKPIVVYHPTRNGKAVSACRPEVLEKRQVGIILNTKYKRGKLYAEGWVEVSRIRKVDERVLESLESDQVTELSTGLITENEDTPGEWNGEDYDAIARNYRPDHLALLPDKVGACSIEKGAGFLRLNSAGKRTARLLAKALKARTKGWRGDIEQVAKKTFVYNTKEGACYRQAFTLGDGDATLVGKPKPVERLVSFVDNKTKEPSVMNRKKKIDQLIANGAWGEDDREFLEEATDEQFKKLTGNAPGKPAKGKKKPKAKAVANEDDEEEDDEDLVDNDEEEDEEDDLTENDDDEDEDEEDDLTENDEDDEEDDEAPPRKKPVRNKSKPKSKPKPAKRKAAPNKVEEYIQNAPPEIRDILEDTLQAAQGERKRLIKAITANKSNIFRKETLAGKPTHELRAIAKLAGGPTANKARAPLYLGAAGGYEDPEPVTNEEDDDPLLAPTMNFDPDEDEDEGGGEEG